MCPSGVAPACKVYIENAACCAGQGLSVTQPWVGLSVFCSAATRLPASCVEVLGPARSTVVETFVPADAGARRQSFRYVASWAAEDPEFVGPLEIWVNTSAPGCALRTSTCTLGGGSRFSRIQTPLDDFVGEVTGRYVNGSWGGGALGPVEPAEIPVLAYVNQTTGECAGLTAADLGQSFFSGTAFLHPQGAATECL